MKTENKVPSLYSHVIIKPYDTAATASAVSVGTETTSLYGSLIGVLGPPKHSGTVDFGPPSLLPATPNGLA